MCSLSRSMASFKIHEDEENVVPNLSAKLKELGSIQSRRVALGELNKNVIEPRQPNDKSLSQDAEKCMPFKRGNDPKVGSSKVVFDEVNVEETAKLDSESVEKLCETEGIEQNEQSSTTSNVNIKNSTLDSKESSDEAANKHHRLPLKEIENFNNDSKKIESPMSIDSIAVPHVESPDSSANLTAGLPSNIKLQLEDLYACAVYKDDIFEYLKVRETLFRPKPYYMKRQQDINYNMRTILVDWLVEVGEEYKLSHQTLFLTVNYVDRFLSSMAVVRNKLQLLGTAAMFLASKFEEIYPPEIGEFTYITDDTYSKKQVIRMESLIVKVLDFNLSTPTSYTFIMHISASTRMPERVMFLSIYICELTLLQSDPYSEFLPSVVASGAIALARHCLDYVNVWPNHLISTTGYTLKQLAQVITHLNETHSSSTTRTEVAMRDKYKDAKYLYASLVPPKKLSIRMDS